MTRMQTRDDGSKIKTAWKLITQDQRTAILEHLERMLEMGLNRQSKSRLAHDMLRQESTRKSMEYDTAVCRGLRWAIHHAQRRPTRD